MVESTLGVESADAGTGHGEVGVHLPHVGNVPKLLLDAFHVSEKRVSHVNRGTGELFELPRVPNCLLLHIAELA